MTMTAKKIDRSTYPAVAREIAERIAKRMPHAYEDSVREYVKHYDEPPSEDDFWAWLEGYDWADKQKA